MALKRVIGFDVDETLGYFSLLTQFEQIVKFALPIDYSSFVSLFALRIYEAELAGKTRFFRPGTKELANALSNALLEKRVDCVFLLSNNPSKFLLLFVAEILNLYAGRSIIYPEHIFEYGHPLRKDSRGAKNAYVIRKCLKMHDLWAENILFVDDLIQGCMFDGCNFINIPEYKYYTPITGTVEIFMETLKTLGIKLDTLPYMASIDTFVDEIIASWPAELSEYMRRKTALTVEEVADVTGVYAVHLLDCVFCKVVIPAIEKFLK